jgi:hypothetical protein
MLSLRLPSCLLVWLFIGLRSHRMSSPRRDFQRAALPGAGVGAP